MRHNTPHPASGDLQVSSRYEDDLFSVTALSSLVTLTFRLVRNVTRGAVARTTSLLLLMLLRLFLSSYGQTRQLLTT